MYGGDEVDAAVIDVGSCTTKAGYAGEDAPKAVFTSRCGVLKGSDEAVVETVTGATSTQHSCSDSSRNIYAGSQALGFYRPKMEVVPALENGNYDLELLEAVWHHAFSERLCMKAEEHPVLLAEPTSQSRSAREKVLELMFEKFSPPAVFVARNAMLSAFAAGRQTALVVDMGHEASVVAAVHDGYVLNKSIVRSPLAGKLLTECTLSSSMRSGLTINPPFALKRTEFAGSQYKTEAVYPPETSASFRQHHVELIAADIKESICRVSDTIFNAEANINIPTVDYELPDGAVVHVGPDRFNVPEILFQPGEINSFNSGILRGKEANNLASIPASIAKSIEMCDIDVRKDLYSGVVVAGGTSLLSQLRDRLEKEVADAVPQGAKVKLIMPANSIERKFNVWIGGSILASLGSFQQMWMSKKEFDEHGASLIHRRAP